MIIIKTGYIEEFRPILVFSTLKKSILPSKAFCKEQKKEFHSFKEHTVSPEGLK